MIDFVVQVHQSARDAGEKLQSALFSQKYCKYLYRFSRSVEFIEEISR